MLCFDFCTAAKSRSSAAIFPFMSMPARILNSYFLILDCGARRQPGVAPAGSTNMSLWRAPTRSPRTRALRRLWSCCATARRVPRRSWCGATRGRRSWAARTCSPAADETETTHGAWIRPADAIAQSIDGAIVLPPPTWTTLRELERFPSVDAALAWAAGRRIVRRMPHVVEDESRRLLLLPGDPLHPDPAGDEPPVETRFVLVDQRWRAERART